MPQYLIGLKPLLVERTKSERSPKFFKLAIDTLYQSDAQINLGTEVKDLYEELAVGFGFDLTRSPRFIESVINDFCF